MPRPCVPVIGVPCRIVNLPEKSLGTTVAVEHIVIEPVVIRESCDHERMRHFNRLLHFKPLPDVTAEQVLPAVEMCGENFL